MPFEKLPHVFDGCIPVLAHPDEVSARFGEDNGTGTFVSASDQPPGEEKGSPKGKNRID